MRDDVMAGIPAGWLDRKSMAKPDAGSAKRGAMAGRGAPCANGGRLVATAARRPVEDSAMWWYKARRGSVAQQDRAAVS